MSTIHQSGMRKEKRGNHFVNMEIENGWAWDLKFSREKEKEEEKGKENLEHQLMIGGFMGMVKVTSHITL